MLTIDLMNVILKLRVFLQSIRSMNMKGYRDDSGSPQNTSKAQIPNIDDSWLCHWINKNTNSIEWARDGNAWIKKAQRSDRSCEPGAIKL